MAEDKKYSASIHLRLRLDEFRNIQKFADEHRCSNSEAARMMMFTGIKNSEEKGTDSEKTTRRKTELAIRYVRDSFKKNASLYAKLVSRILADGTRDAQVIRLLTSLEHMTIDMQKSLNGLLAAISEPEVHAVAANDALRKAGGVGAAAPKTTTTQFKIKYVYMERISIIGYLIQDAEAYDRKGSSRMRFTVMCERKGKTKNEASRKVMYGVFMDKDNTIEYLKKGKQVYVEGTFEENEKGDKLVFADVVRLLGEA